MIPLRMIIRQALEERSRIEDEITKLIARIDELRLKETKIDDFVRSHRALIPAIRRLPVELIQRIFFWSLPNRNPAMNVKEAPMLIGRVCSTWRQISLATPQLWCGLHLHAGSSLTSHGQQAQLQLYGDAVTAWLSRSGNLPLSISFTDVECWGVPDDEAQKPYLLDALIVFSHRWKHINLRIPNLYCRRFSHLTEADVPLLETAAFEITQVHPELISTSLSFLRSKSLHTAAIYNSASIASAFPFCWENLTKIFVGSSFTESGRLMLYQAVNILRACSRLIACALEIDFAHITGPVASPTATIRLLHLETLRVTISWIGNNIIPAFSQTVGSFFSTIESPQLRRLDLTGARQFRHIDLMPFFERHSLRIEGVTFDTGEDQTLELVQGLSLIALCKHLHIDESYGPDGWGSPNIKPATLNEAFLLRLTSPPFSSQQYLCPRLEDVDFRFSYTSDITDEAILRFILARTSLAPEGVSYLKRAHFTFARLAKIDILPELQHVIDEGLALRLNYEATADDWGGLGRVFTPYDGIELAEYYDEWTPGFPSSCSGSRSMR